MLDLDALCAVQISDGAGHAENAVVAAAGEAQPLERALHDLLPCRVQLAISADHGGGHIGVAGDGGALEAALLHLAGGVDTLPHRRRGLRLLLAAHGLELHRRHLDMHIEVPSVEFEAMRRKEQPESSAAVRQRVNAAREVQKRRFEGTAVTCNAYMTPAMIGRYCQLDAAGEKVMQGAFERLGLTGRSHDRILRMARTIADLDGAESIQVQHLAEAIQYRSSNLLK